MGSGINSIGISALQNAQLGLATTSHNIANASTEGYNRQRIIQVSNIATLTGAGYIGQGAHVSTIERIYSSYLSKQVSSAQTSVSELESYAASITELNTLLSDKNAGLASALDSFFKGINEVSSDPASLTTRQSMVSASEILVSRFQSMDAQLDAQYENINSQMQGYVTSINSYAKQIATLNKQIIVAESATNQPPNDLYDQRDQLLAEVNKLVGVQTTTNSNGSLNVYFGNGQQLVVGTTATSLSTVPSSEDPSRLTVGIVNAAGTQELPESLISGGALAGVLQYRSETLDEVANELGRIAVSVALTFNAQHALGQDLLGSIDGDANFVAEFFTLGIIGAIPDAGNQGDGEIEASYVTDLPANADGTFYTNLQASDYRLSYDGANYTLTRLSDNASPPLWTNASLSVLSGAVAASEGFSISLTAGGLMSGDTYLIQPTRNAAQGIEVNNAIAADVRLIAAAAPVRTSAGASNTGSATISAGSVVAGYSAPASDVTVTYDSASGGGLAFSGFASYPQTVTVNGSPKTLASATDTVAYSSGDVISFGGISFTINGTPQDNDTFVVGKNTNGVSDNRNALLLAKLQTGKTMAGNTASFSTSYAQMVSNAGNKGGEVKAFLAAQTALLSEAKDARDSVSGVNLDEEAANLLQYQQAYQAAAKMLQISSELFDSILAIG